MVEEDNSSLTVVPLLRITPPFTAPVEKRTEKVVDVSSTSLRTRRIKGGSARTARREENAAAVLKHADSVPGEGDFVYCGLRGLPGSFLALPPQQISLPYPLLTSFSDLEEAHALEVIYYSRGGGDGDVVIHHVRATESGLQRQLLEEYVGPGQRIVILSLQLCA
ncbi:hypothetical protein SRHO_G00217110 [Serrasalmus rhombeus]